MSRRVLVPVAVGMVALLAGAFFAYLTLRGDPDAHDRATRAHVETSRMVSLRGGFSIGVPEGLEASRHGRTVRLTSPDKTLVVTAGPSERGSLKQGSRRFVRTMRAGYSKVRVLGRQPQKVNGRRALATHGQAVNAGKVKIRFVSVVVGARPRNYTITMFAGFDTDPTVVLPKVNAVANTFKVLPVKKNR